MEPVALVALVHAHPEGFSEASWLGQVFTEQWQPYVPPGDAATRRVRAWVVGGVQDNETLVQSRPVVRDPRADFVADLLRAPSQTTLAAFASTPIGSSESALPPPLAIVRFQRWIGVYAEGELQSPEADALRARLRGLLPDFLIRSGGPVSDRDLVVLSFLAILHGAGELGKPYASPAAIRRGLLALDARLGRPTACNLMVSDGRSLGVLHRGGSLVSLTPPPPPRPARAISQPHLRPNANLLLLDPSPLAPDTSTRIPDGVFTVHVRQPAVLEREP